MELLHAAPEEGHNLCSGAIVVGAEQSITDAVGDAVLHSPCHSVCIVAAGERIAELRPARGASRLVSY